MKSFSLILVTMLLSTTVFACPDISGDFTCTSKRGNSSVSIQTIENGFLINTDGVEAEFLADGKVYDLPSTDSMTDGKRISSCKDDKFNIDFTATLLYEGSVVGKEVLRASYFFQGNNLKIIRKTKVKGLPLPVQDYTCTRI